VIPEDAIEAIVKNADEFFEISYVRSSLKVLRNNLISAGIEIPGDG